jgi:outer membrane protein assembly factor BamB
MNWSKLPLLLVAALCGMAADWPQWRGPGRDGVVPGFAEPANWPEKLSRKWKVKVGEGHSSPVVADGRVFLHSRRGEEEVIAAYDPASGKVLWVSGYAAPYAMNPAATRHGKGVKSTPVYADGRVFACGITGILSALDATSGKLLWRKEFSKRHRQTSPLYGAAMSPLVDRGLLIAHVGGQDDGALTAFDAATGAERWRWTGDGPGYASPVAVDAGGVRQIVTETQNAIVSVNASNGALLWKIPLRTPYDQNSVTPLRHRGMLILSGLGFGTLAVKPGASSAEQVWHVKDVSMYMNSPVANGGLIFGMSNRNRGQFFALDPSTGRTLWTTPGREAENAAILSAGSLLLILKNDAELIVARAGAKSFEPVRRYTVAESETWAHPAPLGSRGVLIKDFDTLALWEW